MKKSWRTSKRALFVKGIAYLLGVSSHVITKVARMPGDPHFPGECCRPAAHGGPCNGYPAETCPGYHAWRVGRAELDAERSYLKRRSDVPPPPPPLEGRGRP